MNKNISAIILIILAAGIYFTFTKTKIAELKEIQNVNKEYQAALDNADRLTKRRDEILKQDIEISVEDNDRLDKLLPDNVDNVRLIIDVKDNIAARHGLFLKGIRTNSPTDILQNDVQNTGSENLLPSEYGTVTLSFGVTTSYKTFIDFMKDLESSLRIMDISKLTIGAGDNPNLYDFSVEVKTYWLKQ
ncbi:MAG: hypothetical protein AAB917_01590 [Patescibacteria group bacterium]